MEAINNKAYKILLQDEKMALGLQLAMGKSSWESGEIMKKSHYKYLEIRHRAEKFMRMFSEHFQFYDSTVPEFLEGTRYVLTYFRLCLDERKKPFEALDYLKAENPTLTKALLNERIIEVMRMWERTSDSNAHHKNMFDLIKDFDRWNNFRILPKDIQEPSAFKRRLKNTYKKHIKVLLKIPEISLTKLAQLFETNKSPFLYFPYINDGGPKIIKVKTTKTSISTFTELSLYLFKNKEEAEKYITCVILYVYNENRDCKDGLEFWPKYRTAIKTAMNYEEVQNILPQRKYLEEAIAKLKFI